jgi:hypothetical protein
MAAPVVVMPVNHVNGIPTVVRAFYVVLEAAVMAWESRSVQKVNVVRVKKMTEHAVLPRVLIVKVIAVGGFFAQVQSDVYVLSVHRVVIGYQLLRLMARGAIASVWIYMVKLQ